MISFIKSALFKLSQISKAKTEKKLSILLSAVILMSVIFSGCNNKNVNSLKGTESAPVIDSEISSEENEASSEETIVSSEEETSSEQSEGSSENTATESSSEESVSSSEESSSSKIPASSKNSSSKKPSSSKPSGSKPSSDSNYKYNSNVDINDNVFLDAMVYTGYNLEKHIADGNMWKYILASQKRGMGYLSNIGYAGGSSGYETTAKGKPDIKAFERKGMVCASYVTYVYFNYLPNVAGIDTSSLKRPAKSYSANDWYIAAKDWVKKGYSKTISFTASKTPSGYINFNPSKNIPIGSIMAFCDARNRSDHCSHIAIYAGYKNGYNWVYHVGNENGPEFCAVERMHFGPDPQWPIKVITTPSNIRFQAAVRVTLKDDSKKPVSGVKFTLKNVSTGKTIDLGKTNSKGVILKENLPYGKYELIQTKIKGYTAKSLTTKISLTTANNSLNEINVSIKKDKPKPSVPETTSSDSSEIGDESSDTSGGTNSDNSTS